MNTTHIFTFSSCSDSESSKSVGYSALFMRAILVMMTRASGILPSANSQRADSSITLYIKWMKYVSLKYSSENKDNKGLHVSMISVLLTIEQVIHMIYYNITVILNKN